MSPVSSNYVSKECVDMSIPYGTETAQQKRATETIRPTPVNPGILMVRTWSAKKGETEKEGMETETSQVK
jgi:hypothetical protein